VNDIDLSRAAAGVAGASGVRHADPSSDVIDGVSPRVVIAPESPEALAATLKWASDARLLTTIRGAGTKRAWGRPPERIDVLIDMRRMNQVLAHDHGDLTATVEAGASLREVNTTLAARGQFLPLDPPFDDEATIGGVVATNDSGPLRHRHGTPRDLMIGTRLATTDGVLAKSGGKVVKNVAGYDLGKLLSGSFGGLAVITSATFKLSPLPDDSRSVVVTTTDANQAATWAQDVMRSQLEPQAFEIATGESDIALALRFASIAESVAAQVSQARLLLRAGGRDGAPELEGADEQRFWDAHARTAWTGDAAVVRVNWLPASLAAALAIIRTPPAGASMRLVGRAALGAGLIRIEGPENAQAAAIEAVRSSPVFRHVVIVRGSTALKRRVDVWGELGDRAPVLASLKRTFDPTGILNSGRGPL
jgi:glycolate oxidase FAD binding subunit